MGVMWKGIQLVKVLNTQDAPQYLRSSQNHVCLNITVSILPSKHNLSKSLSSYRIQGQTVWEMMSCLLKSFWMSVTWDQERSSPPEPQPRALITYNTNAQMDLSAMNGVMWCNKTNNTCELLKKDTSDGEPKLFKLHSAKHQINNIVWGFFCGEF